MRRAIWVGGVVMMITVYAFLPDFPDNDSFFKLCLVYVIGFWVGAVQSKNLL